MSKRKLILISGLCVLFLLAAALLAVPTSETFLCDHCHRQVTGKLNHICEHTTDVTVCADCYQDYIDGKWNICPN